MYLKQRFLFFLCVLSFGFASAQTKTLSGKITDDLGNPLSGATIYVVGGTSTTSSKTDGSFTLSVPGTARQVEVSFVGYTPQRFSVANTTTLSVKLVSTNQTLGDVVVIAYGTVKKEALTGSVGQISAKDLAKRPLGNITRALDGAIPGVVVTAGGGQPGAGTSIRVRGFGSINATSEPLFVVDGVPYSGGTSNINPDDVESITVLKDAASTALYGSRAANGVVIITTKKGKRDRNQISVRAMTGVASRGLPEYERLDAFQYYPIMWESYRNSLVYPVSGTGISLDSANRVASGLTTRTSIKAQLAYNPFNVPDNTIVDVNGKINPNAALIYADDLDWTSDLLDNKLRKDYNVNFSGGSEKSDYFLSMGYLDEGGFTLNTDFKRYTARLNVNVQPKSWIKTGLNISGNYTLSNTAADGGSTNFVNPFFFSRNVGPIYPVFAHNMTTGAYVLDGNGQKVYDLGNLGSSPIGTANGIPNRPSGGFGGRHTLAETTLNQQYFSRTVASARSTTDLMIVKNVKFTNNVSVDLQQQYDAGYENTIVGDGAPGGRSSKESGNVTGLVLSQLVNYNKRFGIHSVDGLAGHESFQQLLTGQRGFKQGQSLSGNTELNNFTTVNATTSYTDKYRIESYFSRFNYDYDSKYLLSASIRRDGNSRFSSQSRWGTFWSVGAGWRLDKESFLKNISWVSQLKLRGSYGVVGVADGISYYAYQGLYSFNNNANEPGISQSQTAFQNDSLTWEKNKQFDIGLDFSLFKNRISGSVEYYDRTSSALLFDVPQPLSSGLLSLTKNTATLYNKGIELQLNGDVVKVKDFVFNLGINISTVKNKITKMPPSVSEFITGTKKYSEGASIFEYWLRTYYGVDPTDGAALYVADNKTTATGRRVITNKSGASDTVTTLISNGKFEYQGGAIPDFYGSITPSFSYKNFSLSALFTFQSGGKTFDANYQALMATGNYGGALHKDILNRWQKPGDISDIPRMDAGRSTDFNATSSRWLVDASYFNIRSMNLSYSFRNILTTTGQLFVSAENLGFFSKRKGLNNQQAFSGVTSNAYPPAKIISGGITLTL